MRRFIIIATVIVLLGGGAFAAVEFGGLLGRSEVTASANIAETEPAASPEAAPVERIVVDARVVPAQRADLSLPISGIAAEALVTEGEQVEEGQVLIRLEAARQKATVAEAEAQLQRAEAALAELMAGARDQEIRSAEAVLEAAQARLDRIQNGPLAEEIASAQASLAEAQADLQRVLEGPDDKELIAAQAELANADASRRQAQAAYDQVAGDPKLWARPEPAQLEQATNNYVAAQARLDDLKAGSSQSEIAAARARVQRSQAQLDLLLAANPADVAAAEAEIRQAQSQLDLLQAGTRPEAIAVAEAEVAAARAALAQAEAALAETELRAPFAGTIAFLDINPGEQVAAGSSIVRLADLTQWQIETEDLTEFDVIGIKQGDQVAINFDAIPDLQKSGVVNRVRPIGEDRRGDIVYTLVIDPMEHDERLLWNLTAVVTIDPA